MNSQAELVEDAMPAPSALANTAKRGSVHFLGQDTSQEKVERARDTRHMHVMGKADKHKSDYWGERADDREVLPATARQDAEIFDSHTTASDLVSEDKDDEEE